MTTEEVEQEFRVFIRKARQAAHQSLFFLYEMESLEQLPAEDRMCRDKRMADEVKRARNQVRVIINGVSVSPTRMDPKEAPEASAIARGLGSFFFDSDRDPPELFRLYNDLDSSDETIRGRARETIITFWVERVQKPLFSQADAGPKAENIVNQLRAFLRITRPRYLDFINHLIDKGWTMARRNMSFLVGLAVATAAFLSVEQLRSLLLNNYRGYVALAVVAFGGLIIEVLRYSPLKVLQLAAYVAPPFLSRGLRPLVEDRTGWLFRLTIKLRLGKRAFYQWASHAIPPERGIERWRRAGQMRALIGRWEIIRALILVGYLFAAYGIALGIVDTESKGTFQTVYPIAALFLAGLLALHWVDLWDFLDPRPIRVLGLSLFVAFIFGALVIDEYLLFAMGTPLVLLAVWAFHAFGDRKVTLAGGLVALVCATTAGFAYWGSKTKENDVWHANAADGQFKRITEKEFPFGAGDGAPVVVMAASGGGSRAAVYTALTLDAIHDGKLPPNGDATALASDQKLLREIGQNIHAISSVSGGSLAAAAYIAERIRRNEHEAAGQPETAAWTVNQLVRKNFLNPTLKGALMPGQSRGEAIERFWNTQVHLRWRTLEELATLWRSTPAKGGRPPFPLPLFNSCALDGHGIVISPLSFRTYSEDDSLKRESRMNTLKAAYGLESLQGLTWILDRDAIYGLDEWNSDLNPTLAQAVRASANFPFGFPLVDVETRQDYGAPYLKGSRRMLLTDGGVLSNSGIWSLYHLIMTDDGIRENLKKRGVLFIVVDASKMPEYKPSRSDFSSLFGAIRDQAPIAQNLHRKMFDLLQREFGERMEIVGIDLPPTIIDNVQTTWALDDRSLKQIECNFDALWKGLTATKDDDCKRFRGAPPPDGNGHVVNARFGPTLLRAWKNLKTRPAPPNSAPASDGAESSTPGSAIAKAEAVKRRRAPSMLRIPLD